MSFKRLKTAAEKRRASSRASGSNDVISTRSVSEVLTGSAPAIISQSLSEDGRRIKRTALPIQDPEVFKKLRSEASLETSDQLTDLTFGKTYEFAFNNVDDEELAGVVESKTPTVVRVEERKIRRRYLSSDQPLKQWTPYRDEYLSELIRNEGRGEAEKMRCFDCGSGPHDGCDEPSYRCLECIYPELLCKLCCVRRHEDMPLHWIEKWNGSFFTTVTLKELGVVVQLGHPRGEQCPHPHIIKSFIAIHVNSMRDIYIKFCDCAQRTRAGEYRQQLLRRRWYPATHLDPHTCATFDLLNHFHIMTLQGKVNVYDYYNGLEKLRNNGGLHKDKDQYEAFCRMIRQWRHLKMLKRAGRGNDGLRPVEKTTTGELAIECPACPRVGVNLPPDWRDVPLHLHFKYWLYLAVDACFRLKRRLVSSEARDPGLGTGWSYFVEDAEFRQYLREVTDQREMCTCTGLAALETANTKFSRGYACTGCGLGVCARHEFVQKNGVVDLQKGERYANMDYGLASLLRHHDHRLTKKLPAMVRLNLALHIVYFVIPKLHIYGHQVLCQLTFSLNWLWGAGRTDGEGIERPWAHMGPVATSTRDMGPGSRHDTLDDHWGHWNWVKLIGLGPLLLRRLLTAISERSAHSRSLAEFTEGQERDLPGITTTWKKMIIDWEEQLHLPVDQRTKLNPYEVPKSGLTESEIRLQLLSLEAEQEKAGIPTIHNISPTSFISQGLELEDQQRILRLDVKGKKFETAHQKTQLLQRRTKLLRAIGKFRSLQATYMPAALQLLSRRAEDREVSTATVQSNIINEDHAETIPIYLPSDLPTAYRLRGCRDGLVELERKLREGQLRNSLTELRNQLHMKSRLLTYRTSNVVHQGSVTRSKLVMLCNQRQIDAAKLKYQAAWSALSRLVGEETISWRKLSDEDVRLMNAMDRPIGIARKKKTRKDEDEEDGDNGDDNGADAERADIVIWGEELRQRRVDIIKNSTGEGYRDISWIWKEGGTGETLDDQTLGEIIRVKWCKSFARAKRWEEEVILVKEEMRRSLVTLEHNAMNWEGRKIYSGPLKEGKGEWDPAWTLTREYIGPLSSGTDEAHAEGVNAYANSQAFVYRQLAARFKKLWAGVSQREKGVENGKEISQSQLPVSACDSDSELDEGAEKTDSEAEEEREILAEDDDEDHF
ncbi:hypothetical protein K435DRAFT_866944 [Dendrothele bispora CBS 962.96]|uniref:CxC2-like cysteine cluster KDZ transposase-associated domain-containing protein n=1 Tax=Dendrothele bispora (strain CBS 962.96) TaxID=1314807 RepID=A0A4S8LFQ3_DENBC|nr:hypothetical protein K435DRAFT_866944 [Dendrothele bispora CBS 962.96]